MPNAVPAMTFPTRPVHERWPDIAKGIGIILVVFGHAWRGIEAAGMLPAGPLFGMVDRAIYAFHMPLFIFLAGWFFPHTLLHRDSRTLVSRLVRRLLFPMVLWTYVFLAMQILAGQAANRPVSVSELLRWPVPPYMHLWFLWALVALQGVAIALRPLALHNVTRVFAGLLVLSLLASLGTMPLDRLHVWFPGLVQVAPFFFLGGLWGLRGQIPAARTYALSAAVAFVLVELIAIRSAGLPPWAGFGVALVAVCAVLVLSRQEPLWSGAAGEAIAFLGQCSMTIYLMHTIFSAMIRIVMQKGMGIDQWPPVLAAAVVGGVVLPLLFHTSAVPSRLRRALGVA